MQGVPTSEEIGTPRAAGQLLNRTMLLNTQSRFWVNRVDPSGADEVWTRSGGGLRLIFDAGKACR